MSEQKKDIVERLTTATEGFRSDGLRVVQVLGSKSHILWEDLAPLLYAEWAKGDRKPILKCCDCGETLDGNQYTDLMGPTRLYWCDNHRLYKAPLREAQPTPPPGEGITSPGKHMIDQILDLENQVDTLTARIAELEKQVAEKGEKPS